LTEALIGKLGYLGIALLLVLGGLGLPIPEEAPIIVAAVLSHHGQMWWPLALTSCLAGVLVGDFIVYFLGFVYGQKVLSLPLTRKFLTRAREAQIQGYFHRHGFKVLVLGRFAVGFRTAAYLTAGILRLPVLRLLITDLVAASLSTLLMFALGYVFAQQIETGLRELQQWLTLVVVVVVAGWLVYRFYKDRQRAGLPVGPPVLVTDDDVLPLDDVHVASTAELRHSINSSPAAEPEPAPSPSPDGESLIPAEPVLPTDSLIVDIEIETHPTASTPLAPEQRS
jgi:membrane protein DedA with SNARE-associated domain